MTHAIAALVALSGELLVRAKLPTSPTVELKRRPNAGPSLDRRCWPDWIEDRRGRACGEEGEGTESSSRKIHAHPV